MQRFKQSVVFVAFMTLAAGFGCADQGVDATGNGPGGKGDIATDGAWRSRIDKDVAQLKKDDPMLWRQLTTTEGLATRAGFLRMRGNQVNNSAAASVFLSRYLEERDASKRVAFIDALPRTGGLYEDAVLDLMDSESDDSVRTFMVAVMGDGKTAKSVAGIRKGLVDPALSVRVEAAVAAGRNDAGGQLSTELSAALRDDSSRVRAAAARALGVHRVDVAKASLATSLRDSDANVRLQALRALSRIDGAFLAAQPDVARLALDDDERVRKVATKITKASR